MENENTCRVRVVYAPDGTEIPIPAGGLGLSNGTVEIRDDAVVQISPKSENGYYIVVNNADPSNNEAADLFSEFTVEGAITTLEKLASQAFEAVPELVFKAAGLISGILVSVFTSSHLTSEVFIRATLENGDPVPYCLLLEA